MSVAGSADAEATRTSPRRFVAVLSVSLDGIVAPSKTWRLPTSDVHIRAVTEGAAAWDDSTLLCADLVAELAALKERSGEDIDVSGSIALTRALLRAGLLDDLHLLVHPVVLGAGRRLFASVGGPIPLVLVTSNKRADGVLHLHYRPVRAGPGRVAQRRISSRRVASLPRTPRRADGQPPRTT
jgi:riboflavin biosynthesis pyrimidine reductase